MKNEIEESETLLLHNCVNIERSRTPLHSLDEFISHSNQNGNFLKKFNSLFKEFELISNT